LGLFRIEHLAATATPRHVAPAHSFHLGTNSGPGKPEVTVDSTCLSLDGKPWLGVMGELHYARLSPDMWRRSLEKMRAGGISIAATYVFWIHHEELEGDFDFTGSRDLRRFVQACASVNMPVVVRAGPWCHGEVRNGGLPDWILHRGFEPRSNDPQYLAFVRRWFAQIANQLDGLLWKHGGPVIGLQVENEYAGPGEHLLTLKSIARELGIDVPLYTRTGWPSPSTPIPFGELLPLYGAYAEGFWARETTPMPGQHWKAFIFEEMRTDIEIGMDQLGDRPAGDAADTPQYPYLTCELGGGMEQSYHRRVLIDPHDTLAIAITRIGSGSNLPGYYMYHGGTNPQGKHTTLHESQATNYWNDVAVKSYDFQAPLGQWGQVREPFGLLRRLHLMLADFGPLLAPMAPFLPARPVLNSQDTHTLRWALRAKDNSGFLFISNHQRLQHMPAKPGVRLVADLPGGDRVELPPVEIPADTSFVWPVGLALNNATLAYATAQLVCRLTGDTKQSETLVFAQTRDVPVHIALRTHAGVVIETDCELERHGSTVVFRAAPGTLAATLRSPDGRLTRILVLTDTDAARASKVTLHGQDRLILSDGAAWSDGDRLFVEAETGPRLTLAVHPPVPSVSINGRVIRADRQGEFAVCTLAEATAANTAPVHISLLKPAGPPRQIRSGSQGVAEAPDDADFEHAAQYVLTIPAGTKAGTLVRVHWAGDVARAYIDDLFVTDQFYHGRVMDIPVTQDGLREIHLRILPLQKSAPIYLHPRVRDALPEGEHVLNVDAAELVQTGLFVTELISD
jgi:hypothetical protein